MTGGTRASFVTWNRNLLGSLASYFILAFVRPRVNPWGTRCRTNCLLCACFPSPFLSGKSRTFGARFAQKRRREIVPLVSKRVKESEREREEAWRGEPRHNQSCSSSNDPDQYPNDTGGPTSRSSAYIWWASVRFFFWLMTRHGFVRATSFQYFENLSDILLLML